MWQDQSSEIAVSETCDCLSEFFQSTGDTADTQEWRECTTIFTSLFFFHFLSSSVITSKLSIKRDDGSSAAKGCKKSCFAARRMFAAAAGRVLQCVWIWARNFIIHNHATQIVKGYYEISRRAILLFFCCSSGASEINMQIIELFCVWEYMEFR